MSLLVKNLHGDYTSEMCTPCRLAFIFGVLQSTTLKLHDPDGVGTTGLKNVNSYSPIYMA